MTTIERMDAFLAHVLACHADGLAWNGLQLPTGHFVLRCPSGPGSAAGNITDGLEAPGFGDRQAMQRDRNGLRRMLSAVAARMRLGADGQPVTIALAEGLFEARRAMTVGEMRATMLHEAMEQLLQLRSGVTRRMDALGSIDIRLDAWNAVGGGDPRSSEVRAYLDRVLQRQSDFAHVGRANLGEMLRTRQAINDACQRIGALIDGARHPAAASPQEVPGVSWDGGTDICPCAGAAG